MIHITTITMIHFISVQQYHNIAIEHIINKRNNIIEILIPYDHAVNLN